MTGRRDKLLTVPVNLIQCFGISIFMPSSLSLFVYALVCEGILVGVYI